LDQDEEWYSCPLKFINQSCYDFLDKFDSYKNQMSTPPDFESQSYKFNTGVKAFEYYLNKYTSMKQGTENG